MASAHNVEQPVRRRKRPPGSIKYEPSEEELADEKFLNHVDVGEHEAAIAMLKKGQQVNVASERGETPVHKAVRRGDTEFVAQLLAAGAVCDYADVDGITPVVIAVQYGFNEIVQQLIKKGASLTAKTVDGSTLLHSAVYGAHEPTVALLLKERAILDLLEEKDANGRTALQVASYRAPTSVCELLVQAGADTHATDKRGNTPATLAAAGGRRNSKEFFDKVDIEKAAAMHEAAQKQKMVGRRLSGAAKYYSQHGVHEPSH